MLDYSDIKLGLVHPGGSWAGTWRDDQGNPMLTDPSGNPEVGCVTIQKELCEVQSDPFHAPVKHLKLHVALAGTKPYDVLVPLAEITGSGADFIATMEDKALPSGTKCTAALRDGMYACSFAPETWAIHDRALVPMNGGLFADGKRLASKAFTIVGELTNSHGERCYVLRTEDGLRVRVPNADMHLGSYGEEIGATIYDGVGLWLHLYSEWSDRTEAEKRDFDLEPLRKQQESIREQLEQKSRGNTHGGGL